MGSECDFLDNRWLWPRKAGATICAIMSDRPTPVANSWRTRPSRPRVSAHSRRSACGPRAGHRPASIAMASPRARRHDAADNYAVSKHVIVIIAPLAGQAGSRGALKDRCIHFTSPASLDAAYIGCPKNALYEENFVRAMLVCAGCGGSLKGDTGEQLTPVATTRVKSSE